MFLMCRNLCTQVVVRVRPTVSRPVDGKDLWFVRKTAPDAVAVGDRSFAVDGVLDDRATQVYRQPDPITQRSLAELCAILNELCELVVVCRPMRSIWLDCP